MISLRKTQRGFTIIELLIVIIVIGILALLVITTFSGIQRNARDRAREADINALHSQLEYYYGQKNQYPTLTELNTESFRTENLKGLDAEALRDPSSDSYVIVDTPGAAVYSYEATPAGCDNVDTACTGYTLTATYESDGAFVKKSLN